MRINEAGGMRDLNIRIGEELKKHPEKRIFWFIYEGRKIWVKQTESVRNERWLRFARCACLVLGLGILQPGVNPNGKKALHFETGRLDRLARRGVGVPEVYASGDGWLALADCGARVSELVGRADVPFSQKEEMLSSGAEDLARLHALGLHHGRPALKDMMWDGTRVMLIDFEDGILIGLPREKRILRDVLLFVQSIFKEAGADADRLAETVFRVYAGRQPHYAARACTYFGRLDALYLFLKIFLRHTGSDLESVYRTLAFFRSGGDRR